MEQLNLQKYQPKKESRYDLILDVSTRLGKPVGQLLSLTAGISHQDLIKIMQSVEALSKDKGLEFSKAFWWHMKEMKK